MLAVGGDKEECLKLFDLKKISEVTETFGNDAGNSQPKAKKKKI